MSSTALEDIQKSLNAIRSAAAKENAETQMAVLALMLSTSESIVQNTRKLSSDKAKPNTRVQKIAIPQTKVVKQKAAPPKGTDDTKRTRSNDDTAPIKPQSPLTPQQQRE